MKWFLNLTTRAKLFFVFGITFVLFAIAMSSAYLTIGRLLVAQSDLREKETNVADFARMDSNLNESRVAVLMLFVLPERGEQNHWIQRIHTATTENHQLEDGLIKRNQDQPWVLQKLAQFRTLRDTFEAARDGVIDSALAGQIDQAKSISLTTNNERFLAMHAITEQLMEQGTEDARVSLTLSRRTAANAQNIFALVGIAVVLISFFVVTWLGRVIVDPLQELVVAAQRVSSGDLSAKLAVSRRKDEVGVLSRSFYTMLENLRTMYREVQDGVNVLASSASEIFTATAEIATSAAETATAVSETTTTVEEVKQTVQVAVEKAGNVADVAQRAANSAQSGRKAVEESVKGMQAIREQMEVIAETVVRLSEQSQAIGEIISSVKDLAEQSNLLAVNASIEAAKAGEHGRGFAVVAQEIRSLANQSKESTGQIRNILNDIQKATTATVMAAEQGSKAVDQGVRQATQSGEAIRTLAESIVSAAQAATQITASSQQQLIGVDQVAIAIQSILQASRQNASGTQQAEAGARNLNELGQKLRKITQRFVV